jgi:hypothetical protein
MKRFEVDVDITMSCRIEVDAESEEQAKNIVANWIGDDPWHYVKDGHYMSHEFEAVNEVEPEDDDPLAKYSETYRDGIKYILSQLDEDDKAIIRAECNQALNQHLIPDSNIVDDSKITDLLEEYGADEELPEGWYLEEYDASEILMMI